MAGKAAHPSDQVIRGPWWEIFGDAQLNALEEQVPGGNQNLKGLEARFHEARAAIRFNALAPDGVDHIVEVAFGSNIDADVEMLKMGGSIGAYATDTATPKIPFWLMVFKNIRVFFLGER